MNFIQYYFNKKSQPELFWLIFINEEWTINVERIELEQVYAKDKEVYERKWIKQVLKKVKHSTLWERMAKAKLSKAFLLNFLALMEKWWIKNEKTWAFSFNISVIIGRIMQQDIANFEFYLYISMELKKARPLWSILDEFEIFKEYIEFFKAIDWLPDEKKPRVFSLLKEKIYKTDEIKSSIVWPVIQPWVLLVISILIIIWFANGIYPQMLTPFFLEWREDLIPPLVSTLYAIWTFMIKYFNYVFMVLAFLLLAWQWLAHFSKIKEIVIRQLFQIKLYRLYNEFFLWYIMKLYSAANKPFFNVVSDLKKSYEDNLYYFFIFNLIETYLKKWTSNVPLWRYWYIFTTPFMNILNLIVKNKDLSLIDNYLKTAEEDITSETKKIWWVLSLIWMITISVIVMSLMMSFQQLTSATQDLYVWSS